MKKKLSTAKQELAGMGVDHGTTGQQRRFLVEIAMHFQKNPRRCHGNDLPPTGNSECYCEPSSVNTCCRTKLPVSQRGKSKGDFVQFEKSAEDSDDKDDEDYEADQDGKYDEAKEHE